MASTHHIGSPFAGTVRLSQVFGGNRPFYSRFKYAGVALKGHNGIDFAIPLRTAVLAVDDGVVIYNGFEDGGFGGYVKLRRTWGESLYAHMVSSPVLPGQFVSRGEVIGASGNTGASTGPHLHFGVRLEGYDKADGWGGFVDPLPMLPEDAYYLARASDETPSGMVEDGVI